MGFDLAAWKQALSGKERTARIKTKGITSVDAFPRISTLRSAARLAVIIIMRAVRFPSLYFYLSSQFMLSNHLGAGL